MIGKLTGVVDGVEDGVLVLDVGGVGYAVTCAPATVGALRPGAPATLWIEMVVREDAIQLFGFLSASERALYRSLVTVQGVGPRLALAMLGALGTVALVAAVVAGDRAALARAPGVGAKLAARIVAELRERFATSPRLADGVPGAVAPLPAGATPSPALDAVSALVNLGFRPADAQAAVEAAAARAEGEAGVEALVKGALTLLMPKEALA